MSVLGQYGVIMTDPPWEIHQDLPYGTMGDHEMRHLNMGILQDEGVIFVWVTGTLQLRLIDDLISDNPRQECPCSLSSISFVTLCAHALSLATHLFKQVQEFGSCAHCPFTQVKCCWHIWSKPVRFEYLCHDINFSVGAIWISKASSTECVGQHGWTYGRGVCNCSCMSASFCQTQTTCHQC